MADIKQWTDEIQNALYGEEVRSSIINALNKVNDDNNSYITIKNEIIKAKDAVDLIVKTFDGKVANAQITTQALENAISTANSAKSQVETATRNANTAKTNIENATSTANTAKSNLQKATNDANVAIKNANSAKSSLEGVINSAGSVKSDLQNTINSATSIKGNLDTTNSTARTLHSNLEKIIETATGAKNQLQTSIDSANKVISNLSNSVNTANSAKSQLDASNDIAKKTLQSLTAENTSAISNLKELRGENFNSQEILSGVADLRAYLGLSDADILGLQVDYQNKTMKRIAGAVNLTAGADFDKFEMFGGRKRCNVADDGTIVAYHGDPEYKEDGSMGQVMVYQPKFYYLVCPVVYDPIKSTGLGYHLRKANYYVSSKPRAGFRLHPAFYDENGNEIDYILMGAFEGSIYDTSAQAYLLQDEQVADFTASTGDKFSSIAGSKPSSGKTQSLTRPNIEQLAKNRGAGWHLENIKIASMNQLLMMIEMGQMELQKPIGQGVVTLPWETGTDKTSSYAGVTGSTSSLGNRTGRAERTTTYEGGVAKEYTVDGKTSITYRGLENPWGNIWKFIYGINIWGNGQMDGGEPYICTDFNYTESKKDGNYEGAGFTATPKAGYISAMGYSTKYDWLFIASECNGNSSLPVGDYTYITENLNGYRIAPLGGAWDSWSTAGGFDWALTYGVGSRYRYIGGRLVYVPTSNVASAQMM